MRPEKVDKVKRKHLGTKIEELDKQRERALPKIVFDVETDEVFTEKVIDVQNSNISPSDSGEANVDISCLVEECILQEQLEHEGNCEKDYIHDLRCSPSLQLTHEEEFKIYELFVRKENLMDGLFRIFFHFPGFLEAYKKSLLSFHNPAFVRILDQKIVFLESDIASGGTIRQCLNMFDEFKNVSENVKTEALQFSLSVFRVYNR